MKLILITGAFALASCTTIATCYNEHGHHPHDHHPTCEVSLHDVDDKAPTLPPPPPPPPLPELDPGHPNNGFGSGNQDAPGKSEFHNNAENAGGNN